MYEGFELLFGVGLVGRFFSRLLVTLGVFFFGCVFLFSVRERCAVYVILYRVWNETGLIYVLKAGYCVFCCYNNRDMFFS